MERERAKLRLDPSPANAVSKAVSILSDWIPVEHLRLGGGTLLRCDDHTRDRIGSHGR